MTEIRFSVSCQSLVEHGIVNGLLEMNAPV